MELCSNGHDEVCFEGRECPVCAVTAEKDKEIDDLNDKVTDLTDQINNAGV